MRSLIAPAEAFIIRLSLALMLALLLSTLVFGGLNSKRTYASGCPDHNNASFGTSVDGGYAFFNVESEYDCYYPGSYNPTYFSVTGGGENFFIAAQGDTWLTQLPESGGARYAETGRSPVYGYPNDGYYYYVQESGFSQTLGPVEWGCMWYNLPDYHIAKDYNCADMV